jgi:FdhD protein
VQPDGVARRRDVAAAEEPLEVRLHREPFSVIMRTPGADIELAAGFLLAEQVLRHAGDLLTIEQGRGHGDDDDLAVCNVLNVTLDAARAAMLPALLAARRQVSTSSSCGLCGRRTIESLCLDVPSVAADWRLDRHTIAKLPVHLRQAQAAFDRTGGLHAAGLFTPEGNLTDVAEDVGRHNAVDKVVGRALLAGALPLSSRGLIVSGRVSFEIVQKALIAGVPVVAAVSAPSTLAIDLAGQGGITLIAFVRGERFNIYTHPERVRL